MSPSVEPVSLLPGDDPQGSPEWSLYYALREAISSSPFAFNGRLNFRGKGLRFKGNCRDTSHDRFEYTPHTFEDGGDITHELVANRKFFTRLLEKRIFVPDYCIQYGPANEEATKNRCQILEGENFVWKGWGEHPGDASPGLRQELIEQITRFHEALRRCIRRK